MLPRDLLDTAQYLANSRPGKPRQADLRRAVSTTYYALFHTLAKSCADLLVGTGTKRSNEAWNQVYRSLEHGAAKNACSNKAVLAKFPAVIQDFANLFLEMQVKRHKADYDPDEKLFKSAVNFDIFMATVVIEVFKGAPIHDRRAFAAWVMFKPPRPA